MQLPGEFSTSIEKKLFFCLVVVGVTPPYTLSGPNTKKTLFLCVSSLAGLNAFVLERDLSPVLKILGTLLRGWSFVSECRKRLKTKNQLFKG